MLRRLAGSLGEGDGDMPVAAEKAEAGEPEAATAESPKLVNVRGQFEMDL